MSQMTVMTCEIKTIMVQIFYRSVFNEMHYKKLLINTNFKINCRN